MCSSITCAQTDFDPVKCAITDGAKASEALLLTIIIRIARTVNIKPMLRMTKATFISNNDHAGWSKLFTNLAGRIFARLFLGLDRADMWFTDSAGIFMATKFLNREDKQRIEEIWRDNLCLCKLSVNESNADMALDILQSLEPPYRQYATSTMITDMLYRVERGEERMPSYSLISRLMSVMLDGWAGEYADSTTMLLVTAIKAIDALCISSNSERFRQYAAKYAQETGQLGSKISRELLAMRLGERWILPILQDNQASAEGVISFLETSEHYADVSLFGIGMLSRLGLASHRHIEKAIIDHPEDAVSRKLHPFIAHACKGIGGCNNLHDVIIWILKARGRDDAEQALINLLTLFAGKFKSLSPAMSILGMRNAEVFSEWITMCDERKLNHALQNFMRAHNAVKEISTDYWLRGCSSIDKAYSAWFKSIEPPLSSLKWPANLVYMFTTYLIAGKNEHIEEAIARCMINTTYLVQWMLAAFEGIARAIAEGARASDVMLGIIHTIRHGMENTLQYSLPQTEAI